MAMRVEVSTVVDRALADAWRFYAVEHVRNHPRWDPDMELEQITEGPIGSGTVIRRRNTHFDTPVEGTMEIVEFEPERVMAAVIHDGPVETHGRATFTKEGPGRTRITISAEFPDMDESSMDVGRLRTLMERTARNIKRLAESEP
jgi:Polyketide cyclase / dehydrase and lipid transport